MIFLHPVYNIIFLFLIVCSYIEVYQLKNKTSILVGIVGVYLVLITGFRYQVGADYPVYEGMFFDFGIHAEYSSIWDKALFKQNTENTEWLYVLINKIIFDAGMPFYMVTFVIIAISISLKFTTIYQSIPYPIFGILMYFMIHFFGEDCGHIRQGISAGICVFSFRYIKKRNLLMFLFMIYLALGFHKTSIVFLPAYWIVKIPMNRTKIFLVLLVSILLSPFEIFTFFEDFLKDLAPQDISQGYSTYIEDRVFGADLELGLNDIIKLFFIFFIIRYNKEACKKVEYYEYMRNLSIFGLCVFYIMRGNIIFAIRLPGVYIFFMHIFMIPSIISTLRDGVKKFIHTGFVLYVFLLYFHFSKINAEIWSYTSDRYNNFLWMD